MFIVDYSTDYHETNKTTTFDEDARIVTWVASLSEQKHFKLVRINKYEFGKLHPYTIALRSGRITIEKLEESK